MTSEAWRVWLVKLTAKHQGGCTDTLPDHEYTDWDDLKHFVAPVRARSLDPRHGLIAPVRQVATDRPTAIAATPTA